MITKQQALNYFNWKNLPDRYSVLDEKFKAKEGDTIIDCGAQYGDISLYMVSRVGDSGEIYAIEANPEIFPYLKNNSIALGTTNIHPICRAITNCRKVGRLYGAPSPSGYSILNGIPNQMNEISYRVRFDTLDNIIKEFHIKKVDEIYMNIEGAEYTVIDGMDEILRKFKPFLHIHEHIHLIDEETYYKNNIKDKLKNYGYTILYDEIGTMKPNEFDKGYSLLVME